MITLTEANKSSLERALARANKEQINVYPGEVTLEAATYYADSSSHKDRYFVTIVPNSDGRTYQSECSCEAGSPTKSKEQVPLICKHVAAALEVYRAFQLRATQEGVRTLCQCGVEIEAGQQECDYCVELRQDWELEGYQERAERPQAYGPFSAKNPPRCKYCGLPAQEEGEGKTCTARYEGYYAHPACQQKADRKAAKKPCACNRQSRSECNPVYCSNCGTSHKDNIAACPGCGYRYW